MTVSKWLGWRI